ncbi:MAG: hypothetical protein PHX43_03820 [Alphaproteobacteria bacterium]|nr:hypothetical protein [Alphaproteobacteria bacterium]
MLKKTITYTDYEGVERKEDFYFNLTKAEVTEMELSTEGSFSKYLEKIIAAKNQKEVIEVFKMLILKAYGEKSADGRRFIKNQQLREEFSQTEAYSEFFMELATDTASAEAFVKGILPVMPANTPSHA